MGEKYSLSKSEVRSELDFILKTICDAADGNCLIVGGGAVMAYSLKHGIKNNRETQDIDINVHIDYLDKIKEKLAEYRIPFKEVKLFGKPAISFKYKTGMTYDIMFEEELPKYNSIEINKKKYNVLDINWLFVDKFITYLIRGEDKDRKDLYRLINLFRNFEKIDENEILNALDYYYEKWEKKLKRFDKKQILLYIFTFLGRNKIFLNENIKKYLEDNYGNNIKNYILESVEFLKEYRLW